MHPTSQSETDTLLFYGDQAGFEEITKLSKAGTLTHRRGLAMEGKVLALQKVLELRY